MASGLHLQPRHRRVIEGLAGRHLSGVEIWAYGSRVNGQSHEGSDLDLVLRGPKLAEISSSQLGDFQEALQESTLPFLVEARDWARLPERFHSEIQRNYAVLVSAEGRWRNITLGDCAVLVRDSVTPSTCPDLPYIGLEHIGQGTLSLNGTGSARDVESTKTAFCAGDILFGKLRPYFRKVVRPRFNGICSTDIWVFRPKENVDAGFLYYLLASEEFVRFASQGAQGTRMPRAKWEQASRFSARLPPVSEQRAIARILGTLDDKIELNCRMNKTLEETVQALFKSWFVNFDPVQDRGRITAGDLSFCCTFPTEFENSSFGRIPFGWKVKAIGEICATFGGATPSTKVDDYWQDGKWCWATPRDMAKLSNSILIGTGRKVTDAGLRQIPSGLLPKGTVLMSSRAPVGYLAIADMPVSVNQGFIAMVPDQGVPSSFLLNWCRFHHNAILSVANGSTFLEVAKRNFRKLDVIVPPEQVMAVFDEFSGTVYRRVALNARESVDLTNLRNTMLPKLLSGKIRIPDAEKIVDTAT